MEDVFSKYGVPGICILLTIQVLVKVGEFLWKLRKEKDALSDRTVQELVCAVEKLEHTVADLPKLRTDLKRFYAAIKHISGEDWPSIRDEILKDEFTL